MTETIEKDEIIHRIRAIANKWHKGTRQGNDGNQGNTLEDLLGIPENNLSIPDMGVYELKTRKIETGSLITLFHKEPQPTACVPQLLTSMGWRHQEAGGKYPANEMSFRMTTPSGAHTARGFSVAIDNDKISFVFDPTKVKVGDRDKTKIYPTYGDWLIDIQRRSPHYSSVLPVYWDRQEFEAKCIEKLDKTLFVTCKTKKAEDGHYYNYNRAMFLHGLNPQKLYDLFASGSVYIDFDARTGHNHGTKLRISVNALPSIFDDSELIV